MRGKRKIRNLNRDDLSAMDRSYFNAKTGFTITILFGAALPSHSMTIDEYYTQGSNEVKTYELVMAIKTEIFREQRLGHVTRAACIKENFDSPGSNNPYNGFSDIQEKAIQAPDYKKNTIEDIIPQVIQSKCGSSDVPETASGASFSGRYTSIQDFLQWFPRREDQVKALKMSLTSQAYRANFEGKQSYAQCVLNNAADGIVNQVLDQVVASPTTPVSLESVVMAVILSQCGEEPAGVPRLPGEQQASGAPVSSAPRDAGTPPN